MSCTWKKVLEHRADGTPVWGTARALASDVLRAADVKVSYRLVAGETVFWSRQLHSVTAARNRSGLYIVSGVLSSIPDTMLRFSAGDGRIISTDPPAYEWMSFNTTGLRHVVKFDATTHTLIQDDFTHLGLTWYTRGRRNLTFLEVITGNITQHLPEPSGLSPIMSTDTPVDVTPLAESEVQPAI